ncbi:Type I restriction modification DNA specificity domain-containing protein [Xylanibacter ruminicola]|uniref:Type I restriction modification DNA specificity domain-containing protein n=1 Tax=Xylanibacter ruminicola TaxID=839 RepID=A0A1M7N9Z8_XYLRU|nr:restriction endonuclease subunit S [Xylanibacter ruminicola]SHN00320.1 Type I restriction modification DNA specificity domain-containing protein [Xylanibacter ruminicola]
MDKKTYKLKDFAAPIAVAVTDPQKSCHNIFVGLEHYDSGEPVISRFSDTSLLNSSCKEFQKNDILIARRNVYLRRAGIAPFDGLTSGDSIVLRLFKDCEERTGISYDVAIKIIPFVLNSNSFWLYANRHADGMNSKRISKEKVLDYEFDLPSLAEQKVLAEKLWAAYEVKQSYLKMIAATEEMVKSQFIEMFGDTHMKSESSRQWKEVVEIINGKDYKSIQVEDGGYPVYGTGGEMARASDYLSPANSILLGRKGTIDKPLLVKEKYWNVDTAFGAVPDETVLNYIYFYWHCKTIDFNVLNKGTTLPSTTKVDLLNLWVKIPGMEEQNRFASIVEQADKSISELRKSIDAIDKVIKSLINENL